MASSLLFASLVLVCSCAALPPPGVSSLPPPSDYDPVADPAAVVSLGLLRVTVLTSRLLRLELAANASWDDRATLSVVNRRLPVPAFRVDALNASAMRLTTSDLVLTYVDAGPANKNSCAAPQPGTDVLDPVRSPAYPNGVAAASPAACCAICNADASCSAWVWALGGFCYPLAALSGTRAAANRTFGGSASPLPPGASLTIDFTAPGGGAASWSPGTVDPANLNGTYTALDCYSTPMECASEYYGRMMPGLLSASGWAVIDDSHVGRFEPAPDLPAGMPTWWSLNLSDAMDVYFSMHGDFDFKRALGDWASIMGRAPMLPASAFGVWWSRYFPYTQQTIVDEVLRGYANFSIPLSNLVFDMDWHQEPEDKTCASWGNYDVNTTKFPDMRGFAEMLHANGDNVIGNALKLSFNVHPQTGVDHCDSRYPAFAQRMGVDPATLATIPCDFGNKTFIDALFSIYFDAEPLSNVDVWWTDYGGCGGPDALIWNK